MAKDLSGIALFINTIVLLALNVVTVISFGEIGLSFQFILLAFATLALDIAYIAGRVVSYKNKKLHPNHVIH